MRRFSPYNIVDDLHTERTIIIMKKALPIIIVALAVVAAALLLLKREEKRLRAIYRLVEDRLSLKKNPMKVEF